MSMLTLSCQVSAAKIEAQYPFKNLNPNWTGVYAPDNGVINVQQLLRSLLSLAKDYGAQAKQHTAVKKIVPSKEDSSIWHVHTLSHSQSSAVYSTKKIVITCGSYVNHVLKPSFDVSLDLQIWEMVASYFNANAGPSGTIFPSTSSPHVMLKFLIHRCRHVVSICARQKRQISIVLRHAGSPMGASQRCPYCSGCGY